MPRAPRTIVADQVYHVLNRGNNRQRIFQKLGDYRAFAKIIGEGLTRYRVELFSWCLMPNHWHLVLRPRGDDQLQSFMQWITLTHVRRHHEHYEDQSGHLYQGRYKLFCVEEDPYFLTLCRYVEANPLRVKLVDEAQLWPWSSLRQRVTGASDPPLTEWPVDRPRQWISIVNAPITIDELNRVRESIMRDRPLGTVAWARRMATRMGIEQSTRDRGRPRKPIEALSKRQRRRRAAEAHAASGGQKGT